jgi:RNA 2',3'-cyclic 3'-phosphodiesterase
MAEIPPRRLKPRLKRHKVRLRGLQGHLRDTRSAPGEHERCNDHIACACANAGLYFFLGWAMNRSSVGRLFLGIPLPGEVRAGLEAHLRGAFGERIPGRAVRPENWHLTLRFLGDTDADRHAKVVDELRRAELGAAFDLAFGALGAFPRPARATVLWVGVGDGADRIRELAATIETAVRRAGFAADDKPFSPHLTVSRIQPPADLRQTLAAVPPFNGRIRVDGVVLFRSHLGSGPPRYERMETFALE